jgi:hypothetical protein
VHPAADVFPLMPDEELIKLGEDIKDTGLKHQIILSKDGSTVLDGRNRLEAMQRAGVEIKPYIHLRHYGDGDEVTLIISSNICRRHLSKQEQADLIVVALKAGEKEKERAAAAVVADKYIDRDGKLVQREPVSDERLIQAKGGRGKHSPLRQKAVAEGARFGIHESTIKRAIAKAEGKPASRPLLPKATETVHSHLLSKLDSARESYLQECAAPGVDLDEQIKLVLDGLKEIAGQRMMASAGDEWPDLPPDLDRRRQ